MKFSILAASVLVSGMAFAEEPVRLYEEANYFSDSGLTSIALYADSSVSEDSPIELAYATSFRDKHITGRARITSSYRTPAGGAVRLFGTFSDVTDDGSEGCRGDFRAHIYHGGKAQIIWLPKSNNRGIPCFDIGSEQIVGVTNR